MLKVMKEYNDKLPTKEERQFIMERFRHRMIEECEIDNEPDAQFLGTEVGCVTKTTNSEFLERQMTWSMDPGFQRLSNRTVYASEFTSTT